MNKLSNVVKNEVVKKTMYDKLLAKVNNIDTSGFVLKTKYDTEKSSELDTSDLVKKTDYNSEISEIENKIPSISSLVTTSAFTAVKNKIPDVSNLVKKQIMTQKLVNMKRNLLAMIMTNILLLQANSRKFCCKISTSKFNNKDRF